MTVYNEAEFVEYAIQAVLPHVDHLVIVEGAYQESIACGASPRSTDGTLEKIFDLLYYKDGVSTKTSKYRHCDAIDEFSGGKICFIKANEQTDKDQRNVGLEKIKELNPDGWLLIVDGDEVYTPENFQMVKITMKNLDRVNMLGAYFRSLTFVNNLKHHVEQDFPRLFKITPKCTFVNDNYMIWPDLGKGFNNSTISRNPYLRYHHYGFCKGTERFKLKKDWWESRFDEDFEYDWYVDENNQLYSPNHLLLDYKGKHPEIMKTHPLWKKSYDL